MFSGKRKKSQIPLDPSTLLSVSKQDLHQFWNSTKLPVLKQFCKDYITDTQVFSAGGAMVATDSHQQEATGVSQSVSISSEAFTIKG